jgi:hypothetical protein
MEQEATQELVDRQIHQPFLVAVGGISPAKGDVIVGKSNEPMVGDSDPMGIVAEIAQRMFRAAVWSFGVNDPVMTEQQSEPGCEGSRLGERDEMAVELELALTERCL